jgi:hypothetical protein
MSELGEGVHLNVTDKVYRGDCCPGLSVTGSDLKRVSDDCPRVAHWNHYLGGGPRDDDAKHLKIGRALHCRAVEGSKVFARRFKTMPHWMKPRSDQGQAWTNAEALKGRETLTQDERDLVDSMAGALLAEPTTQDLVSQSGFSEVTMIWKEPETGIFLKVRADRVIRSGRLPLEIKTAADPRPTEFAKAVASYGYHVSAALMLDVMRGLGIDAEPQRFVIVGKDAPWLCWADELDAEALHWGRRRYQHALRQFAACAASGSWPGYQPSRIQLPSWALANETRMDLENSEGSHA